MKRTVVKVDLPVLDEEDNVILDNNDNPETDEVLFYLLHWGLHMDILEDQKTGQRYPVTYTVGICQHMKTGVIKIFAPEELTVIGIESK